MLWECRGDTYLVGGSDGLKPVAGAEVDAKSTKAGERIEELPCRRRAVVGERHINVAASSRGGKRREDVLAEVAAPHNPQHPIPLHPSRFARETKLLQAVGEEWCVPSVWRGEGSPVATPTR